LHSQTFEALVEVWLKRLKFNQAKKSLFEIPVACIFKNTPQISGSYQLLPHVHQLFLQFLDVSIVAIQVGLCGSGGLPGLRLSVLRRI
jgi:hypothetical protein